jgi:hypothetical protein
VAVASVDIVVFGKGWILDCPHVVHKDVLAMNFSCNVLKLALTKPAAYVRRDAFLLGGAGDFLG